MKIRGLIGAAALSFATMAGDVQSQDARPFSGDEAALHLALSQMCANEAFHSYGDCAMIFQATRRHGSTPTERLAWLRSHSNCVLTPEPPRTMRGNCRWTRNLELNDEQPEGWNEARDGLWANSRVQWQRVRATVANLLRGARPRGGWPCPMDPDTWAGRRTDAQRIAGLPPTSVPLRCHDPLHHDRPTLNEGFRVMTLEQRERFESRFVDIAEGRDVDRD